jgi:hypothetical protein
MRAKRADATQPAIVEALRKVGVSVEHLHEVGKGMPDLLLCVRGETLLMECKVPGEKLNKQQIDFIVSWPGRVEVVHSPEEALRCVLGKAMD